MDGMRSRLWLFFTSAIALMMAGITYTGPFATATTSTDYGGLVVDEWFIYQIHSEQLLPNVSVKDEYLKAVVMTADAITTLNEVFYNENDRIPLILSYNSYTRQSLNNSIKSAWLWVTEEDLADGFARIDEQDAELTDTTPTTWVLIYAASGNSSTYHFDRTNGALAYAFGHLVGTNYEANATVTRIGHGFGGETIEQPNSSSAQGPYPPAPTYTLIHRQWAPPWSDAYTWTELYGYGVHSKNAAAQVNRQSGYIYSATSSYAGPGFGAARAQAGGYMRIPEAPSTSFTVGQSRSWLVTSYFTVRGETYGAQLCRPPWGCASSDAWIWLRMELFEYTSGTSIGLQELVVYDAPPGLPWAYWWSGELGVRMEVFRWYYLGQGTYYFGWSWTLTKTIAAAVGIIAFAYGNQWFAPTLYMVRVGY